MVAIIKIKQAGLSFNQYKIIHSGEEKFYLYYVATIVGSIKGGDIGKTIEFKKWQIRHLSASLSKKHTACYEVAEI